MSEYKIVADTSNTDHFARYFCEQDGVVVGEIGGFLTEISKHALLDSIDSYEVNNGVGTLLLLAFAQWATAQGSEVIIGVFSPTGDPLLTKEWYRRRCIFLDIYESCFSGNVQAVTEACNRIVLQHQGSEVES